MFDKTKSFDKVCAMPGCSYFQDGKYFNAEGKEVKLEVKDGKTIPVLAKKPSKPSPQKANDQVTANV